MLRNAMAQLLAWKNGDERKPLVIKAALFGGEDTGYGMMMWHAIQSVVACHSPSRSMPFIRL